MNNTVSNTGPRASPRASPNNPSASNGNGTRQYIDITNNNNKYNFRPAKPNDKFMNFFKKLK